MVKDYVPYSGPIVTRAEARMKGTKRYFTGRKCVNGHLSERQTSNGYCRICSNLASAHAHEKDLNRAAKAKAWRIANAGKLAAAKAKWAAANAEKRKAASTRWRHKNPEYATAYYRANSAVIKQRVSEWCALYPERRAVIGRNYRAAVAASSGRHTSSDITAIFASQKGRCAYCRKRLGSDFHVDHIQPISKGGINHRRNLQVCCPSCNIRKRAIDPIVFAQRSGLLI